MLMENETIDDLVNFAGGFKNLKLKSEYTVIRFIDFKI